MRMTNVSGISLQTTRHTCACMHGMNVSSDSCQWSKRLWKANHGVWMKGAAYGAMMHRHDAGARAAWQVGLRLPVLFCMLKT